MRRSRSRRLFAALFAPWFAVVVTEPVPMHDCPMHSVHAVVAMHDMASTMMTDDMSTMPGHDAGDMALGQDERGPSAPHHGAHHQCCCLDCCSAGAAAPIAMPPQLTWVPVEIRMAIPPAAGAVVAPATVDHALPFANGPPAARA